MKVSEDKLLDYLDGLLNKEESQAIALAIETDIETANEFNALKVGKELAETAHIYDVMTAPDPSQKLKRDKNLSSKKISWLSWIKFTPNMIPALSACMVVAFIGGLQFKTIAYVYMPETEERSDLIEEFEIATNFVTLENTIRSIDPNNEFEQWSIVNNIAVNIRYRKDKKSEWKNVTNGQNINKVEELEINIQSIKKKYIYVDIQTKNKGDSIKIKDTLLTPGNLIKKSIKVDSDKDELKIIFYSREENKETFEKIGTFSFNINY
jgi:hypothetical protein